MSKAIKNLAIIIHPFIPHISEEVWSKIGCSGLSACAAWPITKQEFSKNIIKMPIQINGKTKSLIDIINDEEKSIVIEKVMADPKIIKNTKNKEVLKTIFVKNKIVNLVVK